MQTTFILASLAGSALASHVLNAAPILKRDLQALQARQTDIPDISSEDAEKCQSAGLDLLKTLPTPPPKLQSDALNNPQTGDPCSFSTPSSLSSEYSSYSGELMSWYSGHKDQIESAFSACSNLASLGGDLIDVCTTALPDGLGGAEATKTSDGGSKETSASAGSSDDKETKTSDSSSNTGSAAAASSTETSTGGAARATGMAVAGLAAGLMAAVL